MFFRTASRDSEATPLPKKIVEPDLDDDEPEVDYDEAVTQLYKDIEEKNWDRVINRIEAKPQESRTWVFRKERQNKQKIRWRLLPLHATCIFRSPLSVIEALVSSYPDGAQMKDDQEMLPIHLACRNGASKGVVLTLLYAFPESLDVRDRKDRTPLDLVEASTSQNREAVLSALRKFKKENESTNQKENVGQNTLDDNSIIMTKEAKEVTYENRTILFRLILKKEWTRAPQRCDDFPQEAGTWIVTKGFHGNLRFLPLHKACVLQPPNEMIKTLIAAYPDGSKCKDQDGWLPIHCASFYGASEDVIDTLLLANPNGAHAKDDEGRMPLHYACLKSAPEEVISSLLRANPKASVSKDDEGRLPIHHACSKGASDGSIEALLKVSPKGAHSKDDQGRLPLHHACRKNATENVVKTLLRIYPRGAQIKDDQDKLPIHYATQNNASKEVVKLLLESYPESVTMRNGFGYTPLQEAKALGNSTLIAEFEVFALKNSSSDENFASSTSGDQSRRGGSSCDDSNDKLKKLTNRVKYLESSLLEAIQIGVEMNNELNKSKKSGEMLNTKSLQKQAEKLADMKLKASK